MQKGCKFCTLHTSTTSAANRHAALRRVPSATLPQGVRPRAHQRKVAASKDPLDEPVVPPLTRRQARDLPAHMMTKYKEDALKRLMALSPESEHGTLHKFFSRVPKPSPAPVNGVVAAASSSTALINAGGKKRAHVTAPPVTPEGLTPSRRNGVNTAILCFSPFA